MKPRSLHAYLVALVSGVAVPLLVFSLMQSLGAARQQRHTVETGMVDAARAVAVGVESELAATVAALAALAASTELDSDDLRAFYETARRVRDQHPWYSVWLGDAAGRQLLSLARPYGSDLPSLAERDYFQRVVATGRPAISGLIEGS